MPQPADHRRGQGTVELLVLVTLVAALLLGVTIARHGLPSMIADRLAGEQRPSDGAERALGLAITAAPGAPTLSGARAWLAEDVGSAEADRQLQAAVNRHLTLRHPRWEMPVVIRTVGPERRFLTIIAAASGAASVRIVTAREEREHAASGPTGAQRAQAGALAVLWDGAVALAHRITRPLGLAISGLRLVVEADAETKRHPIPPGTRADDVIACRPVVLERQRSDRHASSALAAAWRVVILRHGRIVADGLSADDRACRGPAR